MRTRQEIEAMRDRMYRNRANGGEFTSIAVDLSWVLEPSIPDSVVTDVSEMTVDCMCGDL
jgi:hypothetical protein